MTTACWKKLSPLTLFALLAACGGGGDSGDADTSNAAAPPPAQDDGEHVAGTLSMSPKPLTAGKSVTVVVTDADLNTDPAVRETIAVTVVNQDTGESEKVDLFEVSTDSSRFRGHLSTSDSGGDRSYDGLLHVAERNVLRGSYTDAAPAGSRTDRVVIASKSATPGPTPSPGPSDSLGIAALSPRSFSPGATLYLTVHDRDLNTNPGSKQSVAVTIVNQATGETESRTLTETGVDTGSFSGSLATRDAGSDTNDNGVLAARIGHTVELRYADAAPAGERIDSALAAASTVGPTGEWPWAMHTCEGEPDVYWGDYESDVQSADVNRNGIPDVVDASGGKPHFWYDPGALGIGSPAEGDPNGTAAGDTLDAAVGHLSSLGGGTIGIIGLGPEHPYVVHSSVSGEETEQSGFVYTSVEGDVEVCAVEKVAVLKSSSSTDITMSILGSGNRLYKNIKFDGILFRFVRNTNTHRISYRNVWQGNTRGECPLYGDSKQNNLNNMLRSATRSPGIPSGGGTFEDPIGAMTHIEYLDFEMYDCNRNHHSMYWNPEGCFFSSSNAIWRGRSSLEVFRQLCRAFVIENSYFANTLDWDSTTYGRSTLDHRNTSVGVWRDNHIRVMSSGTSPAYAVASRNRRDNAGSGMPNQWPGTDADRDDYAGNDNWSTNTCDFEVDGVPQPCPALTELLTAPPNDDSWLHDGKIWDRNFWREVTARPWRADQRELTLSAATGYGLHDTITGTASAASGTIWKIEGNVYHIYLDTRVEFANGEATAGDGVGVVSSQRTVTARELAENEHMFMQYFSGNVFEAKCVGADRCTALYPFKIYKSIPGTSALGTLAHNRYYIVPRDTDPDLYPGDGYDTEATPGDGWVERVMVMAINNSFVGDWSGGSTQLDKAARDNIYSFNDGTYELMVNESLPGDGYAVMDSHPDAITPATAPPHFVVSLPGTAEEQIPLPSWWPQGSMSTVCNMVQNRYGDDPSDPHDFHWWDEPGAETGHPERNHDGFPKGACP